jgi:hypothetical protein
MASEQRRANQADETETCVSIADLSLYRQDQGQVSVGRKP